MRSFFYKSELFDREVLRPLSHINASWELIWDEKDDKWREDDDGFGRVVNEVLSDLSTITPPSKYHDHEDRLAQYVQANLHWNIRKAGRFWVGADYDSILEQGGFGDADQEELLTAAAGRIVAAVQRNQLRYDDMEESHRRMLSAVLSIAIYQRLNFPQ